MKLLLSALILSTVSIFDLSAATTSPTTSETTSKREITDPSSIAVFLIFQDEKYANPTCVEDGILNNSATKSLVASGFKIHQVTVERSETSLMAKAIFNTPPTALLKSISVTCAYK